MCYGAFNVRFAIYLVVLLAGCASDPYWRQTGEPIKNVVVRTVSGAPYIGALGWAERSGETCYVYISTAAPDKACVERHERMHCAGFDHANGAHGQC